MPQMAPISWLCLFIFFSVIFLMFHSLNYFCFFKKMKIDYTKDMKTLYKTFNWKW